MLSGRASVLAVLAVAAWAACAQAGVLLDEKGAFGPPPDTRILRHTFKVDDPRARVGIIVTRELLEGESVLKIFGPDEQVLLEKTIAGKNIAADDKVLDPLGAPGAVSVSISGKDAIGKWQAIAVEMPEKQALYPQLATGPLMILVALAFAVGWWRWSRARLRWYWVGAGIWTVAVAIKFAWAIAFNQRFLAYLESVLSHQNYVAAGSVYVGLQSSICEIGLTLALALCWRRSTRNANDAIAIGLGAGIFEAIVLGAAGLAAVVAMIAGAQALETAVIANTYIAASTPLLWLAGPVERIIAILCHASSRALIFYGVGARRWRVAAYGFLLFAALDSVAGLVHIGELLGEVSMWWIELSLVPFAALSIPILKWCLSHWPPAPEVAVPTPEAPADAA
jgi:uncharacterized membrane protein YhfC